MAISLMVLVMMMPMMVTTIMTLLTIFLPWCSTLSPICPQRISAVERLKQWKVFKKHQGFVSCYPDQRMHSIVNTHSVRWAQLRVR